MVPTGIYASRRVLSVLSPTTVLGCRALPSLLVATGGPQQHKPRLPGNPLEARGSQTLQLGGSRFRWGIRTVQERILLSRAMQRCFTDDASVPTEAHEVRSHLEKA